MPGTMTFGAVKVGNQWSLALNKKISCVVSEMRSCWSAAGHAVGVGILGIGGENLRLIRTVCTSYSISNVCIAIKYKDDGYPGVIEIAHTVQLTSA